MISPKSYRTDFFNLENMEIMTGAVEMTENCIETEQKRGVTKDEVMKSSKKLEVGATSAFDSEGYNSRTKEPRTLANN